MEVVNGVGGGGFDGLGDRLGGDAVGPGEDAEGLRDGFAADEVDDEADLARGDADVADEALSLGHGGFGFNDFGLGGFLFRFDLGFGGLLFRFDFRFLGSRFLRGGGLLGGRFLLGGFFLGGSLLHGFLFFSHDLSPYFLAA